MNLLDRRSFMSLVLAAPLAGADEQGWTAPIEINKGQEVAVTYRARLAGDVLWVEALHGPGWHTYALDNAQRAEKKAGAPVLGIEKSTIIEVKGSPVVGKWRQSKPKDLSQPEIEWFTWGFEDRALFAARLGERGPGPVRIRINAQACTASSCAMVDDADLLISTSGPVPADDAAFARLIEEGEGF